MVYVIMKPQYSPIIGLAKTLKNSLYLVVPLLIALLAEIPAAYSFIATPVVYFLKNFYEQKMKGGK